MKHAKMDAGVVKNASDCNTAMDGEGKQAIGCKIQNMLALDNALNMKKEDMHKSHKMAEANQAKV